jgi:MFS family permease
MANPLTCKQKFKLMCQGVAFVIPFVYIYVALFRVALSEPSLKWFIGLIIATVVCGVLIAIAAAVWFCSVSGEKDDANNEDDDEDHFWNWFGNGCVMFTICLALLFPVMYGPIALGPDKSCPCVDPPVSFFFATPHINATQASNAAAPLISNATALVPTPVCAPYNETPVSSCETKLHGALWGEDRAEESFELAMRVYVALIGPIAESIALGHLSSVTSDFVADASDIIDLWLRRNQEVNDIKEGKPREQVLTRTRYQPALVVIGIAVFSMLVRLGLLLRFVDPNNNVLPEHDKPESYLETKMQLLDEKRKGLQWKGEKKKFKGLCALFSLFGVEVGFFCVRMYWLSSYATPASIFMLKNVACAFTDCQDIAEWCCTDGDDDNQRNRGVRVAGAAREFSDSRQSRATTDDMDEIDES